MSYAIIVFVENARPSVRCFVLMAFVHYNSMMGSVTFEIVTQNVRIFDKGQSTVYFSPNFFLRILEVSQIIQPANADRIPSYKKSEDDIFSQHHGQSFCILTLFQRIAHEVKFHPL